MKKAALVLSDGSVFFGTPFGYEQENSAKGHGEIVFNTSITGYQEVITDPSYAGQIVTLTYPHIGNTGINKEDMESEKPHLAGFVIRDLPTLHSSWRATQSLDHFLKEHKIPAICNVDTRALTRQIRVGGAMPALISTNLTEMDALKVEAAALREMSGQDLVKEVSCQTPYVWKDDTENTYHPTMHLGSNKSKLDICVIDYGVKFNMLRYLDQLGATVHVFPSTSSAADILACNPSGVLLSNGPGDPAALPYAIKTVQELLGKVPLFGICLGHQLLSLALGAKTFKLNFGHRGINHPVKELRSNKVAITSQNHGFAVASDSLSDNVEITHLSLYDNTVEGVRSKRYDASSVQYHPEAAAGPHDASYLFNEFIEKCRKAVCHSRESGNLDN